MLRKILLLILFPGSGVLLSQPAAAAVEPLTVDLIMQGSELAGTAPSQVRWSGDGKSIYFRWKQSDHPEQKEASTFVIAADGSGLRRLSEEEADREAWPSRGVWNEEHSQFLFVQEGDLFLLDRNGNRRRLTETRTAENSPRFGKDPASYIFRQGANLFLLSASGLRQITDFREGNAPEDKKLPASQEFLEKQQEKLFKQFSGDLKELADRREERSKERDRRAYYYGKDRLEQLELSPDERFVTFQQAKPSSRARSTVVPSYVTSDGFTKDLNSRTKVGDDRELATLGIYRVEDGQVTWVKETEGAAQISGPIFSDDGRRAAVQVIAGDYKKWTLSVLEVETGKIFPVAELEDEAWVGGPGLGTFGWLPDNENLYFISEASGYAHLYTVRSDGTDQRQLTEGEWEVSGLEMSRDKTLWYLTTSEEHPGERHLYSMPISGGPRTRITTLEGRNDAVLSPDEKQLALVYSYSNRPPELYVQPNHGQAQPRRLTESPSQAFREREWRVPELVRIPARDGERPWARFYKPDQPAPGSPAVIFVHGAGYLQNVHKWWSDYFREYMFHNLLVERGFHVLDIDYRGSAGYGRDWRTGIYRHMGGKDLTDQVDGAGWLVANHGVDPGRIGLYGGSYGGFITLMAMFTEPGVFAAGAALRPVTDWAHYNHGYTSRILNQPQDDLDAYEKSSPIYFAEGLQGALLICHGMVDTNVHFQDTVRLAQRLIELGKENWEVAVYPVENHGFVNRTSWTDEYRRILKLFESNLKN